MATFHTTLKPGKGTTTGIEVPAEVVESLGRGKRPPVRVTVNGYTYSNTVAVMNGTYMVSVSAQVRADAGVAAGDTLEVTLELDTSPREVVIPPELDAAMGAETRKVFEGLSASRKKQLTLPISDARTAETKQRRVAKAIESLRAANP
ncbi:YdeI/OmpD-associated family protein [Nocardia bovistercoris]|uniref:DUF1905 domain-containing protein n=1 Tax=Nocardia bovistercoris TaxID=2785916 RepID=A0A931N7F0_9NOCA|nr:YdeI/OmpD-associated family protein [Nocardia bovistercoris]MBH0781717.1 DUF1905 domain-containing protein [Nocardia bovistercoris]